ncbi:MAG: sulfite exporter TauE/SafE family protein [Hyphomicrobiaceae bacterium]
MLSSALDPTQVAMIVAGALFAGFTTGFAGFGTALVASGLWFHALPAQMVPPLVAMASVTGQIVSLFAIRKAFDWPRALPLLSGGVIGIPFGVAALTAASPAMLRTSIGAFLMAYALYQLAHRRKREIGNWGGRTADGAVGIVSGFLGGFAGLSGALPLIWLQLRGGNPTSQRAIYQPFNLIVLALAGLVMAFTGRITAEVLSVAAMALPATLIGSWIGGRTYALVSPQTFQRIVLALLLGSGSLLTVQALTR